MVRVVLRILTNLRPGGPAQLEMAKVLAKNSGEALKWLRSRLGIKLEQVGQLGE